MKQYTAIDDTVYFWFGANDTSGSGGDGATPAADVRLAGAAANVAPIYSPTPSLLSHASYPAGAYEIAIAATAANGFAADNTYAVFCTLAIDSQNPTGFVGSFDTKPVESNMAQCGGSTVAAGAIPNAAADGIGGLPVSDAGGLDLDTKLANANEITTARMEALTDWINGGRLDLLLDAIPTTAMRGTDSAALATGVDLTKIHGVALTETANGRIAAAFVKLFDVATPLLVSSEVMRGTDSAYTGTPPTVTQIRQEMDSNSTKMAPSQTLSEYKATGFNIVVPDAAGVAPTAAEIQTQIEGAGSKILAIEGYTDKIDDATNGLSAIKAEVEGLAGEAMRGTDGANTTVPDTAGTLATYDPPTRTEATADKDAIIADLLTMKKKVAGTYDRETDSMEAIRDRGDDAWTTGAGGSSPTVGEIRAEMEGVGTKLTLALEDTDELQTDWVNGGRLDLLIDRIKAATEIKQSSVNDPGGAATTTKFISALTETQDDFWNRMVVLFTSGNNAGQMRRIKDYNGATKELTIHTPLDAAPANADTFILPTVRAFLTPDIEDVADAVLDELTADHTGAGSLAKAVSDALADTNDLQGNQAAWTTATGFSTHSAADVKTAIEAAGSHLALILADTGTDGVVVAAGSKTGYALTDAGVDAILDEVVEGTLTHRQIIRIILAALAGKSSGGGTVTLAFRDDADSKARITATVDANGNRTSITKDGA
jgi:hypothetical protein